MKLIIIVVVAHLFMLATAKSSFAESRSLIRSSKGLNSRQLPFSYNPHEIDLYFDENPWKVSHRVVKVSTELLSMTQYLLLYSFDNEKYEDHLATKLRESIVALGPTFIKLGQALSSRHDFLPVAFIKELQQLQDLVPPFSTNEAIEIIQRELEQLSPDDTAMQQLHAVRTKDLIQSMSSNPVASASLGQVYKSIVAGQEVAVKVQRPLLREEISADFYIARKVAGSLVNAGIIRFDLVGAIDEVAGRLYEELDYVNEAANIVKFAGLYAAGGTATNTIPAPGIVMPTLIPDMSSSRIITMTWLNGTKLVGPDIRVTANDSALIELGIRCTLSQLLETGFLHADPHGGNMLRGPDGKLVYLDFGLVATIPEGVRDALICSVIYLIERDYAALAGEFDSLMLMPKDVLKLDKAALELALQDATEKIFDFTGRENSNPSGGQIGVQDIQTIQTQPKLLDTKRLGAVMHFSLRQPQKALIKAVASIAALILTRLFLKNGQLKTIPKIKFGEIIGSLLDIARRFEMQVPPYFVNNVRALGTLEGMACAADPGFNILTVVYPYVLQRLILSNSNDGKPKLKSVFRSIIFTNAVDASGKNSASPLQTSKSINWNRLRDMLKQATSMGISAQKIIEDVLATPQGRSFTRELLAVFVQDLLRHQQKQLALLMVRLRSYWGSLRPPRGDTDTASSARFL